MDEPRVIPDTILMYREGSIVRFFSGGEMLTAQVTNIYPTLDPVRFDGIKLDSNVLDLTKDKYPNEGGESIWGYEAMIRWVVRP